MVGLEGGLASGLALGGEDQNPPDVVRRFPRRYANVLSLCLLLFSRSSVVCFFFFDVIFTP
jgi:hypothetical protein